MPVNSTFLTSALKGQVKAFETDLHARLTDDLSDTTAVAWRAEYDAAVANERVGLAWSKFVADRVTQAAVAWVLSTVFVRFCEDNGLLSKLWITGPGNRGAEAVARQQEFMLSESAVNPDVNSRHWLLDAFTYVQRTPATSLLVDAYSPVWTIEPSAYACSGLLEFWREHDAAGALQWDFTDADLDTRFLGDLYENLSEAARVKYALRQTPIYIEEFILGRTLVPALNTVKAKDVRLIDPTCGSGHFLLGAFAMICARLASDEPGMTSSARAQSALLSVAGVDLNPFAVAISRFRLLVAAQLEAAGHGRFSLDTNSIAFEVRVAVGDSLLYGTHPAKLSHRQMNLDFGEMYDEKGAEVQTGFALATENRVLLSELLVAESYDVVVGNPPYIAVSDKTLRDRYRGRFDTCHGKYVLSVPFMERFFQLAKLGPHAGYVGKITSNSFMTREFGTKLVEEYLSKEVELCELIDTSGAGIPGHPTPTVIIVGRNRRPSATPIRAVLGKKGGPGVSAVPAQSPVWLAIRDFIDLPGHEDQWVSVVDLPRSDMATHPWSLTGGSAMQLQRIINAGHHNTLATQIREMGFMGISGADDVMIRSVTSVRTFHCEEVASPTLVTGELVRDYNLVGQELVWFPYTVERKLIEVHEFKHWLRLLWPTRSTLMSRATFGGSTYRSEGRPWFGWHQLAKDLGTSDLMIAFAEMATHNHFMLDRGGKVFNQTAPVIKLPEGATEEQHLELLGVLNSSTACFWLKQNCFNKNPGSNPWADRYQFNATNVKKFPLPATLPLEPATTLDRLAQALAEFAPEIALVDATDPIGALKANAQRDQELREQMIALQEELDWQVYHSYDLTTSALTALDLTTPAAGLTDVPRIKLGERAFEIALARKIEAGTGSAEWFTRHGSTPVTEIPEHWPAAYRDLVQQRLDLIESDPNLNLLERPEYKRRWATKGWADRQAEAARDWVLVQCETRDLWFDNDGNPQTRTTNQVIDAVLRRPHVETVLAYTHGGDPHKLLAKLLEPESVPYLAAYRYKATGQRKRADWEHTWALQRQEDAGQIDGANIPVPPYYVSTDFAKTSYWSHRGKLDVPKERFILYPNAGPTGDASPVLGWAGWSYTEQALAIAQLFESNENEGQHSERLLPLAAGLEELEPWLHQWHSDYDENYSGSPAEVFSAQLDEYGNKLGVTREQLHAWRAPAKTRTRKARS